ncbi:MAG: BACON domain-containing protein [Bacteroidales bacterium]|nr:BACON domain-containing protein [Bacteroidales bacterium]
MKSFAHTLPFLITAAILLAITGACNRKPKESDSQFVVNKSTENSTFTVSPEGGDIPLYVVSENEEWTCQFKGSVSWIRISDRQKLNSSSWQVILSASANTGDAAREAVLLFTSGSLNREVTLSQKPEDPVLRVSVPGFYGLESGDVAYERGKVQMSRLTGGTSHQFSLLFPADVRVVSLTVPSALEEGKEVSAGYRVVEKDRTLENREFTVTVLRIRDSFVWLKGDGGKYFVIKK